MKNGVLIGGRRLGLFCAALCGLSMVGCANTTVDNLETTNRTLKERNNTLQADLEEARAEADILRTQRREADATISQQNEQITALRTQLAGANDKFNQFNDRLTGIEFADLDPETDAALRDIAARFPNTVTYDASKGMLRFSSDLTFDSGSDAVRPEAEESLGALAEVLMTTSGASYEIHIVGHTDSQRIGSATAQWHPTNLHLACHRAISVRRFLINSGVPPQKVMAAGWGEHRPVVPNTGTGNTPQNRRVEIFLTKSSEGFAGGAVPTNTPSRVTGVDPTK